MDDATLVTLLFGLLTPIYAALGYLVARDFSNRAEVQSLKTIVECHVLGVTPEHLINRGKND